MTEQQCNCHTGSARTCPIHTQADFDAADRAIGRGATEPRSDEAIRADLARKAELRAAFRRRLEEVKAGKRGGLIDYATAREEDDLNRRLAADAASLLARTERAEAENARLRAALDRVLQSPEIEYRSDPHLIVNPEGDQRELARAQETITNANATRDSAQ